MDASELERLEAIARDATPGHWRWRGNASASSPVWLQATSGMGATVLGFQRRGLQGAQPVFTVDGLLYPVMGRASRVEGERTGYTYDRDSGGVIRFDIGEHCTLPDPPLVIRPQRHNPWFLDGIDHPDAHHIETFSPAVVLAMLEELKEKG